MSSSEDLKKFAQLMATFNFLQGKKVTYGQIERFAKKQWGTGPMMIISRGKDDSSAQDKKPEERVRLSWNKRCYGHHYSKDHMNQIFEKLFDSHPFQGVLTLDEKKYFIFDCGENGTQLYFGLFELQREVDHETLHLFNLFTLNMGKGWSKLDELKKVENLIHVDDVTGLYNQRKLLKDIETAVERHKELGEVFTVLFIDIDHFKNVNDDYGHIVGTQLLAIMGELLKTTLRESDLIYRYGGDEFVMLIPDVVGKTGKLIGERVLEAVKKHDFIFTAPQTMDKCPDHLKLTVSIGVANFPEDAKDKEEILSMADKMMYEAKKGGRGRVCYTVEILGLDKKSN